MRVFYQLLKAAVWGGPVPTEPVTEETYQEFRSHALTALAAPVLPDLDMPDALRKKWKAGIIQQVSYYDRYTHEHQILPISVPYIVLKGLAAARYYTHPEYRTMGDIDILTRREDYETACNMLLADQYQEMTLEDEEDFGRHRSFMKNGIMIEMHSSFALLRDSKKGKILDDILLDNINDTHYLPDMPNGLVLLDHINQHLAGGLGLRQIIDWMLFVDRCLPDEKWPEFQTLARKVGLETLAVTATRMCVMYLNLPKREWCANADVSLCRELMEYVLSCGNFGNKKSGESSKGEGVFSYTKSASAFFRLLQYRGLINWQAARKHSWLRPFAWIYQLFRYLSRGLGRDEAVYKLKNEFAAAKKKNKLMDRLEVRRDSDFHARRKR